MLRYKTKTRPGLVALYDIRPGNGAGQFLQPQSPLGTKSNMLNVLYWRLETKHVFSCTVHSIRLPKTDHSINQIH